MLKNRKFVFYFIHLKNWSGRKLLDPIMYVCFDWSVTVDPAAHIELQSTDDIQTELE